ncbi:MAG: carbohydrate kinase family protein [Candidatus Andersenbacteria bacterium]|nr:carbohydrate kinase family protein [Candidatus Andersenbacteria bacterium]MBI3251068.1 carbohydrate kinase family protein [Candidatus Andersenbacteria bacterium]
MNQEEFQHDVVAIGDSTQDIFLGMSDANVLCDIDQKNCKICFDYADKIAVDKKTDVPAVGNAANHAIGVARLGLRSAIYTVVGDDDQGKKTKSVFEENGVVTDYMAFDPKHGTNLSIVINYRSERTIFVYHEPRAYDLPALKPTQWIYLTSASGEGVNELHQQTLDFLRKNPNVKLAFNPGTHQIHLGKEKLLPLLERCDMLFLNREESAEILEAKTLDVRELMNVYHGIGAKTMVMTDGPKGSYVSDGKTIWYAKIFDGPVIERTGAGDSFGSAFLSATIKGKPIPEAMMWGNANSTSVVQFIGAREGLLTEEAVAKMIEENSSITAEVYAG